MIEAVPALSDSFAYTFRWCLALVVLNATGWLLLRRAAADWHDRGWAIALPFAIAALAIVVFAAAHLVPAFRGDAVRVAMAGAVLIAVSLARFPEVDRRTLGAIAWSAGRFALPFVGYLAMRGSSHDAIGLEKYMDFGFVAAALRVDTLPVPDPWFAGHPVNYYYFGHFIAALLCKSAGVPAAFGYNLMLATLFGMTFQLAWAFVAEMTARLAPTLRSGLALVAGFWLTLGGNVHGFLYGFVEPWLVRTGAIEPPQHAFLLSDPTRFVGWNPPTGDKLIHEFPAYAFYVGDLHAHLSNLPFVLLFLCVLLAWMRSSTARPDASVVARRGWLAAAGALLGVFAMTNSWDAAMYSALLGSLMLLDIARARHRGPGAIGAALSDDAIAMLAAIVVALPFLLNFRVHTGGVFPTHSTTPAWQWLILYGLQAALALGGCFAAASREPPLANVAERRLLIAMTAFGVAFALLPEFIYLKDIYGESFYRGNTAFKFGFQAFVLLTLAACIGIALMLARAIRLKPVPRRSIAIAMQLALVPPLFYGSFVLQSAFGAWREREWTLDGQRYLARAHPEDRAASAWLLRQAGRDDRIVEGVGESYTYAGRLSANTGIPAVLGWPVHEQLWRGNDPAVWTRRDDIDRLYQSAPEDEARAIVERYGVRWVVVGRYEHERYGAKLDAGRLARLGEVVFRRGETFIVDVGDRKGSPPDDDPAGTPAPTLAR